jgi:hypothetical protein
MNNTYHLFLFLPLSGGFQEINCFPFILLISMVGCELDVCGGEWRKTKLEGKRKFPSFCKSFLGESYFSNFHKESTIFALPNFSIKSPIFQKISQKFVKGKTKGKRFSDLFVNGKEEKMEKFSSLLSAAFSFARL